VAISPEELDKIMTDAEGNIREGTIPPGMLNIENEKHLKKKITSQLPKDFAQIVDNTRNSYIQVIYTADIPAYSKNRIGLIGDAGIVAQPFTGSGVFKGYSNAKNLIKHLKAADDLDYALQQWSEEELINGRKLLNLGVQMEKAFIWNQTKINKMTKEEIKQWWSDSVTFPDHFNYNK
jgi:2-polyprenyl-6-methoxyphenol hydroxylase-like FAD-dependent oxidoreductase